jgi:hypothetical protein
VTWGVLPAFAAVILVFLIREPLIILARQRWVWRAPKPETQEAKGFLEWELPSLAAAGIALGFVWYFTLGFVRSFELLGILGGSAALLTGLAVYMTLRNRQRAIWFQALSAAGLASSGIAACLAIEGSVPPWGWWFWGLHAAHFLAAILVVHARLEARIAARRNVPFSLPAQTVAVQVVWLAAGIAFIAMKMPLYGAAAILSAVAHLAGLRTMHTAKAVAMPMKTVGLRAMALSIVFTLLVVAGSIHGLL